MRLFPETSPWTSWLVGVLDEFLPLRYQESKCGEHVWHNLQRGIPLTAEIIFSQCYVANGAECKARVCAQSCNSIQASRQCTSAV